ncbi:curli assembly protein CsgF [Solimonas sp. K1W22B-7]|uniref:curli assembly protein CsgF n=1 Tax=Solimonas sp. K1W22B-7 TaxID=2303331 RepID=UPI000E32FE52|nr:curli assembly protein CsgF [Solimonas sp. K1W22B-7]AXQ30351.1 curli assembly protein CsgF [Solimonas sp. K1W22B-7]
MKRTIRLTFAALCALPVSAALAAPLVYVPVNPSFGGNPLNGSVLLNEAQSQNDYKAPVARRSTADRLEAFNQALQNAVLTRVQSAVIRQIVGVDGGLIPGTVTTEDFIITVEDLGESIKVTTTDRNTGQTTSFTLEKTEAL